VVSVPPDPQVDPTPAAADDDGAQHQGEAGEPDRDGPGRGHVAATLGPTAIHTIVMLEELYGVLLL
jgi:hypothetical protein